MDIDIHNCPRLPALYIWRETKKLIENRDFEDLSIDAKRIYGVIKTCGVPEEPEAIAKKLLMNVSDVKYFLDGIARSDHPTVRYLRTLGLPPEHSVPAGEFTCLRCTKCGQRLLEVPCIACSTFLADGGLAEGEEDLPDCGIPTEHLAGTDAKINVMAARAAAGFSVFCEDDAKGVGYDGQRKRGIREII